MKISTRTRFVLLALPIVALAVTFIFGGSVEASPATSVFCEGISLNGGVCEAHPQGPGFTYLWTTTGSAYLPTPAAPTAAVRQVACLTNFDSPGDVRVTVVYPDGSTSTVSANVCRPRLEERPFVLPF